MYPAKQLPGGHATGEEPQPDPERHSERDVEQHPPRGLADGHRVRLVIDQEQVGEDDGDEAADGDQPEPQGHVHGCPPR